MRSSDELMNEKGKSDKPLKRIVLINTTFKYIENLKCKIRHAYYILAKELEELS